MQYSQSSCSDPTWQLNVINNIAIASIAVARVIVPSIAVVII